MVTPASRSAKASRSLSLTWSWSCPCAWRGGACCSRPGPGRWLRCSHLSRSRSCRRISDHDLGHRLPPSAGQLASWLARPGLHFEAYHRVRGGRAGDRSSLGVLAFVPGEVFLYGLPDDPGDAALNTATGKVIGKPSPATGPWTSATSSATSTARPNRASRCTSSATTYSVLTRLPGDARLAPADAARLLNAGFPSPLVLSSSRTRKLPDTLSRLGIAGGAVYDALVTLAAKEHGQPSRPGTRGHAAPMTQSASR